MSRESLILTLAVLIALAPFLGLPYGVLQGAVLILSLLIIVLMLSAIMGRRTGIESHEEEIS